MYGSVEHLRAEGIGTDEASDERVSDALRAATEAVDRVCGWYFEPRQQGFAVSGRGGPTIELPVPPVRLVTVRVGGDVIPHSQWFTVGAPVGPGFLVPKLVRLSGVFPRGNLNVWVEGTFGYTIASDTPEGSTPAAIRRATLLLASRIIAPLATDDPTVRYPWRLVEERTRDQSYRMEPAQPGEMTGDPEVDALLRPYRRPLGIGAA